MINGSSIDVRLGNTFLIEQNLAINPALRLGERTPMAVGRWECPSNGELHLKPGAFVLAQTLETFRLPLHLSAEFRLKSSAARMGLSHALAVWCDPGWTDSALTLELHNISRYHTIILSPGDKIGQMVFHAHEPIPAHASYAVTGAYNHDAETSATKPEL